MTKLLIIVASVALLGSVAFADELSARFHVDPEKGDDGGNGSADHPFRTIERARDAVRNVNHSMEQDILVSLHSGRYELTRPVVFDGRDSGANAHYVIYQAAGPDERPVISGGLVIKNWQDVGGGKFRASVPKFLHFRQLYVNGQRAIRARSAPIGSYSLSYGWDHDTRTILMSAADVPKFTNDSANPVELVAQVIWSMHRLRLAAIEPAGNGLVRLVPMEPERTSVFNKSMPPRWEGQYLHLENALEFVDEPGEWYWKSSAGELYYMPRPGEDITTAEVVIPVVETLFDVRGTYSKPVQNIWFEGLTFEHSNFIKPDTFGYIDHQASRWEARWNLVRRPGTDIWDEYQDADERSIDAAVQLTDAIGVRLVRNTFRNIGGNAITLSRGCRKNVIDGNRVSDIAGNGIQEGIFDDNPQEPLDVPKDNRISNNFITRVGRDYYGAVGIMAGYTQGLVVEHNEVVDTPYTGISIGWGWTTRDTILKNNVIRNNQVVNWCTLVNDGAAIYTLSKQPGTIIESNYLHDAAFSKWAMPMCLVAIYLDEGSSYISVRNNVWRNNEGFTNGSIEKHVKEAFNVFENNESQDPTIIAHAGLEPEYQSLRTEPMADPYPHTFTDAVTVALSYAPGYRILYTLDGSDPVTKGGFVYQKALKLTRTTNLKARAFDNAGKPGGLFAGTYTKVAMIEEACGKPGLKEAHAFVLGSQQQRARSESSGLAWGGHAAKPGGPDEKMILWEPGDGGRLIFASVSPDSTAIAKGTYAYTIFSSKGDNRADRSLPNMQNGRVQMRVGGGDPSSWLKYHPCGPPWPVKLRALIRDRKGQWYLSTADTAITVAGRAIARIEFAKVVWQRVNPESEKEMNLLRPGYDPGKIQPLTGNDEPDLSLVTGGGAYIESVANEVSWFEFQRISWISE